MIRFAAILGLAQGLMPFIGWIAAVNFHHIISNYDHWIAFVLLLFLGGKMIVSSFDKSEKEQKNNPFSWAMNLTLGIATSIDALVAGIAMALVTITIIPGATQLANMLTAVGIITMVTMIAALCGLYLGRRSRSRLGSRAELLGGLILIAIGTKVLIEHLTC